MLGLMAWPRCLLRCLVRVLLLAALAGCSKNVEGELTARLCDNDLDDDGDGSSDCQDVDCWVFCPPRSALEIGDASSQLDSTLPSSPAPPQQKPDAGKPNTSKEDDAGMSLPDPNQDDAGAPSSCNCAADEECVDGACRPLDDIEGTYELSIRSAFVPLYNAMERCYDYNSPGCAARLPVVCECVRPDPYVVVLLNRNVLSKATTPEARGTASPVWPDAPKVQIMLKAGDTLTFVVYDGDGIGQDTEIFRCSPDLSPLANEAPVLSCSPAAGMTMPPPRGGNFAVTADVRKILVQ
jgi:hypothetical protein